jgi:hypothetical protein
MSETLATRAETILHDWDPVGEPSQTLLRSR